MRLPLISLVAICSTVGAQPATIAFTNGRWFTALVDKVNRPNAVDVIFANGGLNVSGGHPYDLAQRNNGATSRSEALYLSDLAVWSISRCSRCGVKRRRRCSSPSERSARCAMVTKRASSCWNRIRCKTSRACSV